MANDSQPSRIAGVASRRQILRGATASALALGGASVSATALASRSDDGDDSTSQGTHKAMPTDAALVCDASMNSQFDSHMRLAADPIEGGHSDAGNRGNGRDQGRGGIVHVTTAGTETQDYPCMSVDLRDQELTLGTVAQGQRLTYEYVAGENHQAALPGEAFLTVRTNDDAIYVAFRRADDQRGGNQWHRRGLSQEIRQDEWRALKVDPELVNVEGEQVLAPSAQVIEGEIGMLLQQDPVSDLEGHFGTDADLLALTLGIGNVVEPTIVDAYFRNLTVHGQGYAIPAQLTMDPTFETDDGTTTVTLTTTAEEHYLNLGGDDGVVTDSVHLSSYDSIARPIDGTAAWQGAETATSVTVQDGSITAEFESELSAFDEPAMVFGALEHHQDWPVTFLATDDW